MRIVNACLCALGVWAASSCIGPCGVAFAWSERADVSGPPAAGVREERVSWSHRWDMIAHPGQEAPRPFAQLGIARSERVFFLPDQQRPRGDEARERNLEFSFAARTGIPSIQVGVAQRTRVEEDDESVRLLGREYRLGDLGVGEFKSPTWDDPQWYVFAAKDDGAITWTPGARSEGVNAWRIQEERLMVGDFQAGVSVEASGVQASLSYMQRDAGRFGKEEDASFTGLSVTLRR